MSRIGRGIRGKSESLRTEPTTARFAARRTSQILSEARRRNQSTSEPPSLETSRYAARSLLDRCTLWTAPRVAATVSNPSATSSGRQRIDRCGCPAARSSSTARRRTTPRPRSLKRQTPADASGWPSAWGRTSGRAHRDAATSAPRAARRVDLALPSPAAAPTHCFPVHHTSKRSANCSKSSHPLVDSKARHAPGYLLNPSPRQADRSKADERGCDRVIE